MLITVLLVLVLASWAYWIIAWWLVRRFFREQPVVRPDFSPPVSILKPLKGLDTEAYENFATFCRQDYPHYEVLFGVADPSDPVIPVVRRVERDFPDQEIRLIVAPPLGANSKASILHALAKQARHDVLVVSDSDMRVTPDYLRRVVSPLADEGTGMVTCTYRGERPLTLTARLEALYMGVTFLPSVLVARKLLAMRFALGASITLRRRELERIGGFAAVADYLADDYRLGVAVADLGMRVHLSNYVMASVLGPTTFREQRDREVRWAHCTRISRPWGYRGLLLSFSTPLAVALLFLSGFSMLGARMLAGSLVLRWMVGWLVSGHTQDRESRRWLAWLPIRDMLTALVWVAGAVGRQVTWRDREFTLRDDGKLEPVPALASVMVDDDPASILGGSRPPTK